MVRKCSVKGCKSESFANCGTSFHSLPNDPERREQWLSVLPLKETVTVNTHICSRHFREEDYLPYKRTTLKREAVPSNIQNDYSPPPKTVWPHLVIFSSDTNRPIIQSVKRELPVKKKKIEECVRACRVCLATDRKMVDLRDSLKRAYEEVTGVEITFRDIASINRKQNDLESKLSCSHFGPDDFHVHVNEQTVKMEIGETDPNLLPQVEHSSEHDHNYSKYVHFEMDIDEKEDKTFENYEYNCEVTDENENENDTINDNHGADDDDKSLDEIDATKETTIRNVAKRVRRKRTAKKKKAPNPDKLKTQAIFNENFTATILTHEEQVAEILNRRESDNYKHANYKCELCYRGFADKKSYNYHNLKHTDKYGAYECPVCKRRQKSERFRRRHMLTFHSAKYSCKKCVFTTHCRSVAVSHIKHHDGVMHQCPHCQKQFVWQSTYYSHMRLKHACAYACALCGHTFISEGGLRHHKRLFHLSNESEPLSGPYCAACDVRFVSAAAHDKHLALSSRHRSDGELIGTRNDPFTTMGSNTGQTAPRARGPKSPIKIICELCGATCTSSIAYTQHFRWKHPAATPAHDPRRRPAAYMCEQCGNKYQNMWLLSEHKRTHSGERQFACACGKTFVKRVNLIAHRHVHDPARRTFPCDVCGKRFGLRANQRRHMLIHSGLKPFECETCGKRFGDAVSLRSHVAHVHDKRPWPRRQRPKRATSD